MCSQQFQYLSDCCWNLLSWVSQIRDTNSLHLVNSFLLKLSDQLDFVRELFPPCVNVWLMIHLYQGHLACQIRWTDTVVTHVAVSCRVAKGWPKPKWKWQICVLSVSVWRRKNILIQVRLWRGVTWRREGLDVESTDGYITHESA